MAFDVPFYRLIGFESDISGMETEAVSIGMKVRYPRTGTTGTVQRIEVEKGEAFALLDTTGLLYRIDHLVPAGTSRDKGTAVNEDLLQKLEKEKFFTSGLEMGEAIKDLDQSCEGGG